MIKNTLLRLNNALNQYEKYINLGHRQKEALKIWYDKYEAGDLKTEVRNHLNFSDLILKNLLGYKRDEDFKHEYSLGGKRVDFMIMKDGEPYIAIELKNEGVDLNKPYHGGLSPVEQASNYANKEESIKWYIVSNYYEFRLYSYESQKKYIKFNLDDLKQDENKLKEFLLVFGKKSVVDKDILSKLYDSKGLFATDYKLENEFYNLFNQTRLMLIQELKHSNDINRDEAISYAQLILNRYIFICFCEDKNLLPDNTSSDEILTPIRRKVLAINTIWSRLNELFYFINYGNEENKITGYNGGLFKEDISHLRIRDKIDDTSFYEDINVKWSFKEQEHIIDNELKNYPNINPIYRNLLIISSFDFDSTIDVNILGHIFENSISDIEEIKEEKTSKRKKDGVYYTPEYITKYICENTIIPYLSNEYNNTVESLINEYKNDLNALEDKLHAIKICDPACGSGAFLNKATDTLLAIYKAIHSLKNFDDDKLDKTFDDIDNRRDILLNNIYGVDLNHESVEITKLGLFLKVCKKGIKLPNLDKNIKCGNSLIDDPNYTDSPFDWEEEFSDVFEKGGFDIVVGNPPYVDIKQIDDEIVKYIFDKYTTSENRINLYSTFIEKGFDILRNNGYFSFIIPNSILFNSSYEKMRFKLLNNTYITNIIKLTENTFPDAKVEPIILVFKKTKKIKETHIKIFDDDKIYEHYMNPKKWLYNDKYLINIYSTDEIINLIDKINHSKNKLVDFCDFSLGITPYDKYKGMSQEDIKNKIFHSQTKKTDAYKELLNGSDVTRYNVSYGGENYINYGNWLAAPREERFFKLPRIIVRQILSGNPKRIFSAYTEEELYNTQSIFNILLKEESIDLKYILAILNSKLMNWYHSEKFIDKNRKLFPKILIENTKKLPIAIKGHQKLLIGLVTEISDRNKELHDEIKSFHKYLISDFNVVKINNKLKKYYNLSFEDLYNEVKKQYKKITRKEKDKLENEFKISLDIINPLQEKITSIDKKIDKIVYELYDLTDEEIAVIEKSFD